MLNLIKRWYTRPLSEMGRSVVASAITAICLDSQPAPLVRWFVGFLCVLGITSTINAGQHVWLDRLCVGLLMLGWFFMLAYKGYYQIF
jgi:hypothetical protein